jgi:hypothetical protein
LQDGDNSDNIKVITIFRDKFTYNQGKREIGEKEYTIKRNSDFTYCLNNPFYIINNAKEAMPNYDNQHKGFEEFYNCAVVVPIICEYKPKRKIYGYLTCDVLNSDINNTDIMNEDVAYIMTAASELIGSYFDNMNYLWQYMGYDDFLCIIYKIVSSKRRAS